MWSRVKGRKVRKKILGGTSKMTDVCSGGCIDSALCCSRRTQVPFSAKCHFDGPKDGGEHGGHHLYMGGWRRRASPMRLHLLFFTSAHSSNPKDRGMSEKAKTDKDKLVNSSLMASQINEVTSDWPKLRSSVQPVCEESKCRWLAPSPPEAPHAKEQGYLRMEHALLKCSSLF